MPEAILFFSSNSVPVIAVALLCAATALVAMALIAWIDCTTFEIDFGLLGVAALSMAGLIMAAGGPGALAGAASTGLGMAVVTWLAWRWSPGRIGQGDIWLMGFLGFAAGLDHAQPVLLTFCLLCALTAAAYSHARGKRLFKSMFPAALPGMGAALLALLLRLGELRAEWAQLDRTDIATWTVFGAAACLGALTCAVLFIAWNRWRA